MNGVIEDVVAALQKHSQGLHQDTLLIVMGDHAQTLSGDHGGGTPEEVMPVPDASFLRLSCGRISRKRGVDQSFPLRILVLRPTLCLDRFVSACFRSRHLPKFWIVF